MASKRDKGSVFRLFSVGGIICACFAVITLAMCYLCIEYTDYRPEKILLLHLGIYIGIVALMLVINIEEEFKIELPIKEASNCKTVGDIVAVIEKCI